MAKIKVLHIITRLIIGGAQENTMYTAEYLDKLHFQVDVISGPQTGMEGSLIDEFRIRGIHLLILPQLVREINPIKDVIAIYRLSMLIRKNHYSIVHTHSSKAGILGRIAAFLASSPVIVHTVHGWSFHNYLPHWVRSIYILLERFTARFTDAIIVVSKNDLTKGINNKISQRNKYFLIHSAIPLPDFSPALIDRDSIRQELGVSNKTPLLGFIGRFSPQKNPLEWVRVAALVQQAVPDCHFLMVGNGPLRNQVTSLLIELDLVQNTTMTGLRRDIPQLLSIMDVLLLTSLWEGLPRVIPEAMLVGVPVVASAVDGSAEIIQNDVTGYICTPGDSQAHAECCIELLINPKKRSRIAGAASKFAFQQFDLLQMVTKIDQLYTQLLGQHGK
jgi:glycosyltransferase involved in cell wall biosynthesis